MNGTSTWKKLLKCFIYWGRKHFDFGCDLEACLHAKMWFPRVMKLLSSCRQNMTRKTIFVITLTQLQIIYQPRSDITIIDKIRFNRTASSESLLSASRSRNAFFFGWLKVKLHVPCQNFQWNWRFTSLNRHQPHQKISIFHYTFITLTIKCRALFIRSLNHKIVQKYSPNCSSSSAVRWSLENNSLFMFFYQQENS